MNQAGTRATGGLSCPGKPDHALGQPGQREREQRRHEEGRRERATDEDGEVALADGQRSAELRFHERAAAQRVGDPTLVALLLAKAASASEHGVALSLTDDTSLEGEAGDKEALITIVGNLVDNAIEAISTQGSDGDRIEVTLRPVGDDLQIRVADSGPGIPPDLIDDVFTDGYTTKAHDSGASRGLGLALVHQAVHRHGGRIDVSNKDGAVLTVTLPGVARPTADAQ